MGVQVWATAGGTLPNLCTPGPSPQQGVPGRSRVQDQCLPLPQGQIPLGCLTTALHPGLGVQTGRLKLTPLPCLNLT